MERVLHCPDLLSREIRQVVYRHICRHNPESLICHAEKFISAFVVNIFQLFIDKSSVLNPFFHVELLEHLIRVLHLVHRLIRRERAHLHAAASRIHNLFYNSYFLFHRIDLRRGLKTVPCHDFTDRHFFWKFPVHVLLLLLFDFF